MEDRVMRGLAILLLLAGYVLAIPENELETGKQKSKSILQLAENWWYSVSCTVWGIFPTSLGSLPLKLPLLKGRMIKVGPATSCLNLILNAEFRLPSSNDITKLKESKQPVVWVLGGPGSGKGTFCKMMASSEGYTHISVGDLLRTEVKANPESSTNQLIDLTMKQGSLLPDSVSLSVLARKMLSELDRSNGFLIDGFPRSLGQAKLFQNKIKPPASIIYLKVSDEIMKKRMLKRNEGRSDDNEETFKKRVEVFHKQQELVTSNKMFADKVKEVNAEGESIDENFKLFSKAILESIKTTDSDNQ